MFERFTDRSRKVMALANAEAMRFQHEYVGTEHILLGLVKEGSGVASTVLKNLDIDLRKIRLEVEKLVKTGPDMLAMGKLPQTPRAKKAVEFAIEEARSLYHNYVGTEHLLLGILREHDGVAAQVLMNLGVKLEDVRAEVLVLLGVGKGEAWPMPTGGAPSSPHDAWVVTQGDEKIVAVATGPLAALSYVARTVVAEQRGSYAIRGAAFASDGVLRFVTPPLRANDACIQNKTDAEIAHPFGPQGGKPEAPTHSWSLKFKEERGI